MKLLSHFRITFVITCVTLSTCLSQKSDNSDESDDDDISTFEGIVGNSTLQVFYVRRGDTVKLPCTINLSKLSPRSSEINGSSTIPKWTKLTKDKVDMASHCRDAKTDDDEFKCDFILNPEDNSQDDDKVINSMLRIRNVGDGDYGTYKCGVTFKDRDGQKSFRVKTVQLREAITITRKSLDKGQRERSVLVQVHNPLYLYCNYTGIGDDHKIVWYSDNISITEDLEKGTGLFKNFTQIGPYEFEGLALHEHRRFYTCSVELKNATDGVEHSVKFPVEFTFHVRVREGNRWIMPTAILAGEILLLGILTICWWRKVESVEGGVDGNFADSDDEEDQPAEK